jgi:hypothetical protein
VPGVWLPGPTSIECAARREERTCSLVAQGCRWSGHHLGRDRQPRQGRVWYSRKVPQRTWTRADLRGRRGTVTCRYGRGWTCCRQMACKRSAVRARLAPQVRSEIRTNRTASTAGKYSNGGRLGRRMCVRSGIYRGWDCWQNSGFQVLNRRWSVGHLRKSPCHRSRDSWHPLHPPPSWKAISASDCCRICK